MTEHDRVRQIKALRCNRQNREELIEAIGALQSTDDPSLVPLHNELQQALADLDRQAAVPIPGPKFEDVEKELLRLTKLAYRFIVFSTEGKPAVFVTRYTDELFPVFGESLLQCLADATEQASAHYG